MRRLAAVLALLLGFTVPAFADPPIPALTSRVVDEAAILDQATIDAITSQLADYEAKTSNQVVVVTLPDLKGTPIEVWGHALGHGWRIGQRGKDNGVLLIVAPNDRQLRIEVGIGLERDLPNATAYQIIQSEIIPHFKDHDLRGGVRAGVNAILAALGGSYRPATVQLETPRPSYAPSSSSGGGGFPILPFLIFGGIFLAIFLINIRRISGSPPQDYDYDEMRRRRDRRTQFQTPWNRSPYQSPGFFLGNGGLGGGFGGSFGSRSSSSASSGGFRSSGSSGGGFSGGGGSFGGGGASGRW